jgi:hypothetical protein
MMRPVTALSAPARVALIALVLAMVTSCASGTPAASPVPAAGTGSAGPGAIPSAAPGPSVHCDAGGWQSVPAGVTRHVPAPATPVITGIRAAAHPECGYDRLVLDISGALPSLEVRYVSQVTTDPSGRPITLPGHRYLLITLRPAQAHDSFGSATITRSAQALGYRVLKGYALAGDFEGVFSLALGLAGPASIRIGELPGHWYIDVRT